jgi:hypothetical protein
MGAVEVFTLALAKTDAGGILSGSADWTSEHTFDCENCGALGADAVRQAERDEVCLYVCRGCGAIGRERLPFWE